jgi:hypothetical protein
MYIIDISYISGRPEVNDSTIYNITDKYPKCNWYSSDYTTTSADSQTKQDIRTLVFTLQDGSGIISPENRSVTSDLCEIIGQVKETEGLLFISLVYFDGKKIYQAKKHLETASGDLIAEYKLQVDSLNGINRQIHDLCVVAETDAFAVASVSAVAVASAQQPVNSKKKKAKII